MTTNSALPVTGYIGTYTKHPGNPFNGRADGIYAFSYQPADCRLELVLAARTLNPSWLALSESGQNLYAVNELYEYGGFAAGAVSAFGVEKNGSLRFVNQQPSGGTLPCHIALFRSGAPREPAAAGLSYAAVSNYASGTLAVFPLGKDGALASAAQLIQFAGSGPNRERQDSSHAHSFFLAPDKSQGFACDLGADCIAPYSIQNGSLVPFPRFGSSPGAGPRHGLVHPNGKFAYSVNELDSTVDLLELSPGSAAQDTARQAALRKLGSVSTLPPENLTASTAAAIKLSPDARFLYASNRGHNSITVFALAEGGLPKPMAFTPSGGITPRDFAIDKSGNFLFVCHQDSDNLVVFDINRESGLLTKRSEHRVLSGVCVIFA